MGSWYETCFVSNLTIGWQGRCRRFFLVNQQPADTRYHDGFCNPTSYWTPCTFGVPGSYDDYGKVIYDDCLQADIALDLIKQWYFKGENPRETLTLVDEEIQEGTLISSFFNPSTMSRMVFGSVLIREDVYQMLIHPSTKRLGETLSVEAYLADGPEFLEKILEKPYFPAHWEGWWNNWFAKFNEWRALMIFYSHLFIENEHVKSNTSETLRLIAETEHLNHHLCVLRKSWNPTAGKGSQNTASEQLAFYRGVLDLLEKQVQSEHDEDLSYNPEDLESI